MYYLSGHGILKMRTKLTQKQEKFCLKYIETGNASEAYRQSYNTSKMKPETIHRKAKELMDAGKIAARIKELQEEAKKNSIVTARMKKDLLWVMANEARVDGDFTAAKGCINELNKMDGDHAPTKTLDLTRQLDDDKDLLEQLRDLNQ